MAFAGTIGHTTPGTTDQSVVAVNVTGGGHYIGFSSKLSSTRVIDVVIDGNRFLEFTSDQDYRAMSIPLRFNSSLKVTHTGAIGDFLILYALD